MGCDIHMYVEVYDEKTDTWHHAQPTSGKPKEVPYSERLYTDRDYALFGMLAGVRCPGLSVFVERGFPDDASDFVEKEFTRWGSDAHTPSYLNLEELRNATLQNITVNIPMANSKEETLNSILQDYQHANVLGFCQKNGHPHVKLSVPITSIAPDFWSSVNFRLPKYRWSNAAHIRVSSDEHVRIVFWFDN